MLSQPGSTDIKLYLQHGWAFDSRCWQGWPNFVGGCHTVAFERGYWGSPVIGAVEKCRQPVVVVAHSLGLHFLQEISLEFVDLLVIISGFRYFHGEDAHDGRFSRRHLQRMNRRLLEAPLDLIHDFYNDCAYPCKISSAAKYNMGLLVDDLHMLDTHELDIDHFSKIPNIIVLQGQDDRIVPPERAVQLSRFLQTRELHYVPGAGHGLPFTHPQFCIEIIAQVIEAGL